MVDDSHCDRIHSSLTAVRYFDNGYVGKQPVPWKEYCVDYWLKELQESVDRSTGCRDITEILLKTPYNQSINPSFNYPDGDSLFANDKFYTFLYSKSFQMTVLNLMKIKESSPKGRNHCGKRRNCSLVITSNFSFTHSVLKHLKLHTRTNKG